MDEIKDPSLKAQAKPGTTDSRCEPKSPAKATFHRSRTRISNDLLLSKLGTFFLAALAASALFITKRYDVRYFFGLGEENHWEGPKTFGIADKHVLPGSPKKEYAICTRVRDGIYTVDEVAGKNRTQCIVVGTEGTITGTGSIGIVAAML